MTGRSRQRALSVTESAMPWKETCRMKRKQEFVLAALSPDANVAELCRAHGICRKTGYEWLERFREGGLPALEDMSRRPHASSLRATGDAVLKVVGLRRDRPRWGPKKLRAIMLRTLPADDVPSVRTIARVLERARSSGDVARLPSQSPGPKARPTSRLPDRMICGRWTSRAGGVLEMVRAASRSRYATHTAGSCSARS